MSSWDHVLELFPPTKRLELTDLEADYLPLYATNGFAAFFKDTCCIFALFQTPAIWCEGVGTLWRFTSDNTELVERKFRYLVSHLDEVKDFNIISGTATFQHKQIK